MSSPTLTVKDVWRGVLPPGTDLLGGGGGLERRVEWACALRTRPPAFEAVKGGEIAFVPVKSIRLLDERLDLLQVMVSFAEKGGVAVAVVGDVSVESIAASDRLMMPLLRLPASHRRRSPPRLPPKRRRRPVRPQLPAPRPRRRLPAVPR